MNSEATAVRNDFHSSLTSSRNTSPTNITTFISPQILNSETSLSAPGSTTQTPTPSRLGSPNHNAGSPSHSQSRSTGSPNHLQSLRTGSPNNLQSHSTGSLSHLQLEGLEGAVGGVDLSSIYFLKPDTSTWKTADKNNDDDSVHRAAVAVVSPGRSFQTIQSHYSDVVVDTENESQTPPSGSSGFGNFSVVEDDNTEIFDSENSETTHHYLFGGEQRLSPSLLLPKPIDNQGDDLSTRIKMLILGSEGDEPLPDADSNEPSNSTAPRNWTVNARGLTVCPCGDVHRCFSKRSERTTGVRRRTHQSSQAAQRPRYPVAGELRSVHYSRPHVYSNVRENDFRNINRITGRETSREAARRYLRSVMKN